VPGDDVSVNVTFPEDYHQKDYAGKAAVFEVELLDVKTKEYPEIDDDFAQDISEFDTLAEYKEDLANKIKEAKEKQAETTKLNSVMEQLVKKAVMDVPEVMYTARLEEMLDEFEMRLRMQGMNLPLYYQYYNITEEKLMEGWQESAHNDVQARLVLEAIAKKEAFDITDDDVTAHLDEIAKGSGQSTDDLQKRLTPNRRKDIEQALRLKKAQDFVLDKAIAVEP
jgi:trigger factor